MGLLLAHKRTRISIYPDLVVFCDVEDVPHAGGGKRSEISVFSQESRYRLFRMLHCLEFKTVTFATLTYPSEFPTQKEVYKAHLKEYRRRFERRYGAVKAVWRLEFQQRGAPHYHIMYLDAPFIPVQEWCGLWSDVIGTSDENHRKIGVDVKLITESSEGRLIASYLAKYVGKVDQSKVGAKNEKPGRWWGKWNIEETKTGEIEISAFTARAVLDRIISDRNGGGTWEPADPGRCSVFGDSMGSIEFANFVVRTIIEEERKRTIRSHRATD